MNTKELKLNTLREAYGSICHHIKSGPLPGNGWDEQAERNGLILAANIISNMIEKLDDSRPAPILKIVK